MSLWRKRNVQHNGQNQHKWFNMTALANNDLSIKSDDLSIKPSKGVEMSTKVMRQVRNALVWNLNTDLDNIPTCEKWAKMLRKNIDDLNKAIKEAEKKRRAHDMG